MITLSRMLKNWLMLPKPRIYLQILPIIYLLILPRISPMPPTLLTPDVFLPSVKEASTVSKVSPPTSSSSSKKKTSLSKKKKKALMEAVAQI
jgi:hypothetical protein